MSSLFLHKQKNKVGAKLLSVSQGKNVRPKLNACGSRRNKGYIMAPFGNLNYVSLLG